MCIYMHTVHYVDFIWPRIRHGKMIKFITNHASSLPIMLKFIDIPIVVCIGIMHQRAAYKRA